MTVHGGAATGAKRTVVAALLAVGVVMIGQGMFLNAIRLDDADGRRNAVGAMVALLGLPMAVYSPCPWSR